MQVTRFKNDGDRFTLSKVTEDEYDVLIACAARCAAEDGEGSAAAVVLADLRDITDRR